jgi:hypothetical protein
MVKTKQSLEKANVRQSITNKAVYAELVLRAEKCRIDRDVEHYESINYSQGNGNKAVQFSHFACA